MALNEVTMTVRDGGLGVAGAVTSRLHCKIGCSASGTENAVTQYGAVNAVKTDLVRGPLARALGHALAFTTNGRLAGPALGIRAAQGTAGYCGPVRAVRVASSTGAVTVAGAAYDRHQVQLEILTTGILGTARARYSLDGGRTFSQSFVVPAGGTYSLPDTNVTVTFGAGSYDDGDFFYFRTVAPVPSTTTIATAVTALKNSLYEPFVVHIVGGIQPALSTVTESGTTPPDITLTGTPADFWAFKVIITTAGARGTAEFQYSLDGGTTYNGDDILTAATYVVPETGVTLNFATGSDYSVDNEYTFNSSNITGIGTLYAALKTQAEGCVTAFRYTRFVMELPLDGRDSDFVGAVNALADSPLVSICGGSVRSQNGLDSREDKVSAAWPIVARCASIDPGVQPLRRKDGPLALVVALDRDERQTPAFDDAKIASLRSVIGLSGFYVEKMPMRSSASSDIRSIVQARVVDILSRVGRAALLQVQGDSVRVDSTTGFIVEEDAATIGEEVAAILRTALAGQVSSITVTVTRTNNILTTEELKATISAVPLGYANTISAEVALTNPQITQV